MQEELTESKNRGVKLVEIPPAQWNRFRWPDYQRSPNKTRVNQIARGLKGGYEPGPITLYEQNGYLNVVDGGHRVMAYMRNKDLYGLDVSILALLYEEGAIEQNLTFIHENTKMRMNPANIILADNRSSSCALVRSLSDSLFASYNHISEYPINPLSLIKAAVILDRRGTELAINSLAYLSVANAIRALDSIIEEKGEEYWEKVVLRFIRYILEMWGYEGRHLCNFAILGFAYFLAQNRPVFFTNGELEINRKWSRLCENLSHVSGKCVTGSERKEREVQSKSAETDRSDYGKLAAMKTRWENLGDQMYINAPRDPVRIALEINMYFWKNRRKSAQVWWPEPTNYKEAADARRK